MKNLCHCDGRVDYPEQPAGIPLRARRPIQRFIYAAVLTCLVGAAGASVSRASFVIDSLNGDITQNEINNFISTVAGRNPATNNWGNAMATHGTEPEGMWRMYEATTNISILNHYIRWMDVYLAYRNDMPLGAHRVMWEGTIAPVWPNIAPGNPGEGYAGCESGMVAGYIASCARWILETPAIWTNTVPDGNPYGFGVTYRDRALRYLSEVDYVCENYLRVWFVNPSNNRIRKPADSRWASNAGNQSCTAWNRQWLFIMGFMYSARCHDLLGDNPAYLATYKNIVQQFATWFVASYPGGGGVYYTSGGRNVVKWYYEVPTDQHIENIGHAQHDVFGLYECFASPYTTLTYNQVQPYADTAQYVINGGATNIWSLNVDGTGTGSSYLKSDFIYLSRWNRPLFKLIAQSNLSANQLNVDEGCKNTAYILYMKRWMFQNTPGGFYVTATPAAQTIFPGSNATFTVSLTTAAPLTNGVVFSVSGLPANTSAIFNPAAMNTDGNSTLTLTTTAGTPTGLYALTIIGANNAATNTTPATLIVSTNVEVQPGALAARLNFDDGTGYDSSGRGNHGTLLNGASVVNDVDRGKALDLDGSNDYVDLGSGSSLDLSDNGQATITAWVKMAASQNHNSIVTKGEWKDAYSLLIKGDTTPDDLLWTGNDTSVFSGASIPANTWTHVALVINGDLATFYLNGQVSGTANQDRGNAIDNTGTAVSIGREQYATSLPAGRWFFNGRLDDVRVYEVALTLAEIQAVMVSPANEAPSFSDDPLTKTAAVAGEAYDDSIAGDASDPNAGDSLSFSKLSGPGWLNVAADGGLSGTPGSGDVGTNSFVVRVRDSGNLFDEATLNITVSPASDFVMAAAPSAQSTSPGSNVNYTVTVTPTNGFAGDVELSVNGLPTGTDYSFDPPLLTGSGVSMLTLVISNNVPSGDYPLNIVGISGDLTHSANVTLTVNDSRLRITDTFISGSDVILSGTNGVPGGTFYLLTCTNLWIPLTNWSVIGTGLFDSAGGFSFTNTFEPTNRRRFFVLQLP